MLVVALALATASQPGGPVAPLPTGSHFGLWSLTTGELLQHSATPPLHTRFGPRPHNVTGALVKPPLKGLCTWRQEMSAWRGSVVLCGDWTFPGCSIEERSRVLTAAGVAAAVFMGTEGLPLDWDGSSYDSIGIPAIVINPDLYGRVASTLESTVPSGYMVWLAPQDSPLLHDQSFMLFDRTMQIVFFCAAAANIFLAIYQLINIRKVAKALARSSKKLKMRTATQVISLELVSALGMTGSGGCHHQSRGAGGRCRQFVKTGSRKTGTRTKRARVFAGFSTVISHLTRLARHAVYSVYLRRAVCPSASIARLVSTPLRSVPRPPFVRSQTAQNNTTPHAPGRAESAQKLTSYIPHCTDSMLMQMHCVRERSALVRSPASCGERPSPPHPGHPYRSWATAAAAM